MARSSSNIRVFVEFENRTVFAGEDVECTITFKHVNRANALRRPPLLPSGRRASIQNREIPDQSVPPRPIYRGDSVQSQKSQSSQQPETSSHRPALSLNVSSTGAQVSTSAPSASWNGPVNGHVQKHSRRISIISIGSDGGDSPRGVDNPVNPVKANYAHSRSTSLQTVHERQGHQSPSLGMRAVTQPSPLSETMIPSKDRGASIPHTPNGIEDSPLTSQVPMSAVAADSNSQQPSTALQHQFKFPPEASLISRPAEPYTSLAQSSRSDSPKAPGTTRALNPKSTELLEGSRSISPRIPENATRAISPPLNRVMSLASVDGTPRSSAEFYSMSNHSDETLASEYPSQLMNKLLERPGLIGGSPYTQSFTGQQSSETLMMGYAKIAGSFVLDGSLVNPAPFEEIKRRGILGGQGGGGVVGVERSGRQTGLFGSLGWSSIGESIGGILGSSELSSIREMRGQASSKSIPLLSTPQSILFVDLRLAPGESRSYKYSFTLPNGLPPSHRGRAMRISYHLVIGTQRPASLKNQKPVRQVEIPFRVFGGVNLQGEPFGHDLMSPYIMLKDQARTSLVDDTLTQMGSARPVRSKYSHEGGEGQAEDQRGAEDFQNYVKALLSNSKSRGNHTLLSPTDSHPPGLSSSTPQTPTTPTSQVRIVTTGSNHTAQDLIDRAIHLSTRPSPSNSNQSSSHFTIARASVPVATILLPRPAFRLGDPLTLILDFASATNGKTTSNVVPSLPAYAVALTLESYEFVSPTLSLRSAASIERATRRVWARDVHCVLWADRVSVRWQIPSASTAAAGTAVNDSVSGYNSPGGGGPTPEFLTSGVGLQWRVRLEIVVAKQPQPEQAQDEEEDSRDDEDDGEEEKEGEREQKPMVRAAAFGPPPRAKSRAEELLEEVARDDRGSLLAAMENLACESFEVCVPIRVYGAITSNGSAGRDNGIGSVGLAV